GAGASEARAEAMADKGAQQEVAGAGPHALRRPCDALESGGAPPAVGEYLPAALARGLGVDRRHDALRAVAIRRIGDETRVLYPRRVDRYLVGARIEQPADILDTAHAAADGERDEDLVGHPLDHLQDDVALVARCRDVEKGDLVGALLVVATGDLDRV